MAEIQYRNRSISQLVSELNHLGQPNVLLSTLKLIAVHEKDIPDVKRLKNSIGQQFFMPKNSEKKFNYTDIVQTITSLPLSLAQEIFQRGFNVSLIFALPKEQGRLMQLLSQVVKITGSSACSSLWFGEQAINDSVTGHKITERDFEGRLKYFKVMQGNLIAFLDRMLRTQSKGCVTLIKLRSIRNDECSQNQINLLCLPQQFFSPSLRPNQYLGLCKSQLSQIFNYIKTNPSNKYQHFSKLLTKRLPITNIIAGLVLEESASFVINWMSEGGPALIHERLSFFDKMRELSVLLKKQEQHPPILTKLPQEFHFSKPKNSVSKVSKTDRTPIAAFQEDQGELDYCRSFQRKTHKYSINDLQLFDKDDTPFKQNPIFGKAPSPVTHFPAGQEVEKESPLGSRAAFDSTMPRKRTIQMKESEQIAILKANHAIQISQYHQTIQQLNKKILVLTKENNLEQLYTIHQRQIMLLQLKIKELRNDINLITNDPNDKTYKSVIRKLNDEIKRMQSKSSEQKISNAKSRQLQKQLAQVTKKYQQSETARKKLTFELQHLTKRLKICDTQIEVLNNKEGELKGISTNKVNSDNGIINNALSLNDNESLRQVDILIKSIEEGSEQSKAVLIRKITNILTDLSSCRNIILECNDFLMQLQEHLEEKLGSRQPQIVLDCNKFIRNFLMDNLNIF